jgi:predicted AlkP superfamily pyrophosphatase or phosphodiesterase
VRQTVVINCVGLTPRLISPANTPRIEAFIRAGRLATVGSVLPAVTCSVQATYLTGKEPREHGIVGNGWYDRIGCEITFWKQSGKLVQRPRIWDLARQRDPNFTCANICWWHAMYSSCDYTVTPRPMYPADGRKIPDCWTNPPTLRDDLQRELGPFPLFHFWGPATSIQSTQWIADAAIRVDRKFNPTMSLIYLPHLDYVLQRGGSAEQDLRELDAVVDRLLEHFDDARVVLLSEYGITPVSRAIHLNRVLREKELLTIRQESGRDYLDAGASVAFAVADHQIAHVYVNDRSQIENVRAILEKTEGVASVTRIEHERAGDLVCLAEPDAWFTYYFWADDARAPDYARTVDIHRKPGYDPVELFTNASKATITAKLVKKKLGFRTLMDVIPLDATLVKGSHGLPPREPLDGAMLASNAPSLLSDQPLEATAVCDTILRHVFEGNA